MFGNGTANYSYNGMNTLTPQQMMQMQGYANALVPNYGTSNSAAGGLANLTNAVVNGFIQNPSLKGTFGQNNNTNANIFSGLFGGGQNQNQNYGGINGGTALPITDNGFVAGGGP